MKRVSILLLFITFYANAQDANVFKPDSIKKELEAVQINSMLKIDGVLNDVDWKNAKPSPRFIQIEPYQGKQPNHNTDVKVLIGTTTITDRIDAAKRAGYGVDGKKKDSNIKDLYPGEDIRPTETGGDGAAAEFLFNERYTLQPRAWYERK